MKNGIFLFCFIALLFLGSCSATNSNKQQKQVAEHGEEKEESEEKENINLEKLSKAYFASGCFWCVEAVYESVKGVSEVVSGYSGGVIENPTYEQISSGRLLHAEAVEVYYDPAVVTYETLVEVFFGSHDPTTPDQQGPDKGPQYRSIAFYQNEIEQAIIEKHIVDLSTAKAFKNPIVTGVVPFRKFWEAEEYHQNYERKHPNNGYVRAVSIPRLNRFKKKFPDLLKGGH